jgi:hypothetical protein
MMNIKFNSGQVRHGIGISISATGVSRWDIKHQTRLKSLLEASAVAYWQRAPYLFIYGMACLNGSDNLQN